MHKYKTFPTSFTAKEYPKLLPKLIAVHTPQSWKQKWHVTIVIPRMHCYVKPDVRFLRGLVYTTTCYCTLKIHLKDFAIPVGVHSTTFYPTLKIAFKSFCQSWGVLYTTFYPTLKIERFTLINFMEFLAILSTFQSFQICIFNRK